MRHIIVGFSKPKKANPLSNAIMWFMGTKFSHVYLAFQSNTINRTLIYQANRHGVFFIGKEKFDADNIVIDFFLISLTEDQYKKALQKCVDLSGEQYGVAQLIGIGIKELLKKPMKWLGMTAHNPFPNKYKYICSELVVTILIDCDFLSLKDINVPLEEITPEHIYQILSNH
ncbi:MAG: hypothetical protein QXL01_00410 [Thermoplasmatales archaeon]